MNGFISDSCNMMRCLRAKLVKENMVDFLSGCSAHPIYNLVEELLKVEPFQTFLKHAMPLSKAGKYQGL